MAFFSEWPSSIESKKTLPGQGTSSPSPQKEAEKAKFALAKFDSLHKSSHLPPPRTPQRLSRSILEQLYMQLIGHQSLQNFEFENYVVFSDGASFSLEQFRSQEKVFLTLAELERDPLCSGIRLAIRISLPSIMIVRISLSPPIRISQQNNKFLVYSKMDDILVSSPDERTGSSHHLVNHLISSHAKEAAHFFFDECQEDSGEKRFRNFCQWLLSYKTLFVSESLADHRTGQTRKGAPTPCVVCGKHLAWDENHQNLVPPTFRNFVTYEPCHSIHLSQG